LVTLTAQASVPIWAPMAVATAAEYAMGLDSYAEAFRSTVIVPADRPTQLARGGGGAGGEGGLGEGGGGLGGVGGGSGAGGDGGLGGEGGGLGGGVHTTPSGYGLGGGGL
jgi:hypothetical protein